MKDITAILSMLHHPAGRPDSATRLFRREPVLAWTLRRLSRVGGVNQTAIVCWEDQAAAVRPIAAAAGAHVLVKGPRCEAAALQALSAAQRWADGWRGGLLATSCFDRGFHGPWHQEIVQHFRSDAALLVDADAALVDPVLLEGLIGHAREHPTLEYWFSQAAPGLSGFLISRALLEHLAASLTHPGKLLHYWPDLACRDPISTEHCMRVPVPVARTTQRFLLDSDRQVRRIERMTLSFNGQLMQTEAEALVVAAGKAQCGDDLPRELTLELNSERATSPIYRPGRYRPIVRPEMNAAAAAALLAEAAECDDLRLTLGGAGDPMLRDEVFDIIAAAAGAGIAAIHVETDLAGITLERVRKLAEMPVDVVSVHVPALSEQTYGKVMGSEGLAGVIENVRQFLLRRQELGWGAPILAPTLVKCRENLHEMEAWYDYWLRATGVAVIAGPSDHAGQIGDCGVADMSPPLRGACRRLSTRLTVLCNGQVASCENDVMGMQALGAIGRESVREICAGKLAALRQAHAAGEWDRLPLCAACRDWDRP